MSFRLMYFIGILGMGLAGVIAGAAAGTSIAVNLDVTDLGTVGIVALVGGILGIIGGVSVGVATLWGRDGKEENTHLKNLPATLKIAQIAWVLIVVGIALPYLAGTFLTVLHLSQIGSVNLNGVVLSRAAGLLGAVFWVDGIVLQAFTVIPSLRVLVRLALTLL